MEHPLHKIIGECIGVHPNNMLVKSLILLENLDFTSRNIDEIKGRIDMYCEQKQIQPVIDKREIEKLLTFLFHDLLMIVNQEDGKYSLRFPPPLSKEKLKNTIRRLCTESLGLKG